MQLVDTHCHIHEAIYDKPDLNGVQQKWIDGGKPDADDMIEAANKAGVSKLICVGTTLDDSVQAAGFAQNRTNVWSSIGIHPHEAKEHINDAEKLQEFGSLLVKNKKIVAIGECGLDYFYNHSPRKDQTKMLEFQLQLAVDNNLPVIFHVRQAFDDFWPIFANFRGLQGVLHSFTDSKQNLQKALNQGLYIGINGIMTFTKQLDQLEMTRSIPLKNLLLETDAPFLTPTPERGKICQPKHTVVTAEFLAGLRDEPFERLAKQTTANAKQLFGI